MHTPIAPQAAYPAGIDKQAGDGMEKLIEDMKQPQGIAVQLKEENAFGRGRRINGKQACTKKIVNEEAIRR